MASPQLALKTSFLASCWVAGQPEGAQQEGMDLNTHKKNQQVMFLTPGKLRFAMGRCPPDNWPVPAAAFEVLRSQSRDLARGCQQGRWSWVHPSLCPFWDILTPGTELNVDVSLLPLGQCPSLGAGGPGASPHPMGLSGSAPFSLPLAGTGGQGAHTALARMPPGAAPARISGGGRGGGAISASSQPCPIPAAPPAGQGAAGRFGSQPQLPRTGASQCLALLPPEGTHQQPGAPHHPWHQRGTSRVRGAV